jgi:hypothetical protein
MLEGETTRIIYEVLVFISAFCGGMATAIIGYLGSSGEGFIWKKFLTSAVKSFIGAALIVVSYEFSGMISIVALIPAFLAGAGVEAGFKRVSNAVSNAER